MQQKEQKNMYCTCKEVAEMFKVKVRTVWRWIREGRLNATWETAVEVICSPALPVAAREI